MIDVEAIAVSQAPTDSMIRLVELVFGIVIKSEDSHEYIEKIMSLD